jgi:putative peptidoglycan lipid II flippase
MKLALQLGFLSFINLAISFLFQWLAVTLLGPGIETDALFASMTLPLLVLSVVVGSLMQVLVPLFSGKDGESLRKDAWGFFWLILLVFGLLATILFLAAPFLVPLTVPGFGDAGKQLAVQLTQIQLIGMVLSALNSVQWATYHARQSFIWAEVAGVLSGIFSLIILIFLLPIYGVYAVAWISIFRLVLQGLLLLPGMGLPTKPDLRSMSVIRAWTRIRPLLIGSAYTKTEPLIDRFFLSSASGGVLSIYGLAQQMCGAVNQVLAKSISSPLVPALSRLHKAEDSINFQSTYQRKIILVAILCSAGYIFFFIFGEWTLKILLAYGKFNTDDIVTLYWILIWLGGVFIGGALGQIASSSFYATGDTKSPVFISITTYTIYIPIKILVYEAYSFKGLALLASIYYLVDFFIMYIYQYRQNFLRLINFSRKSLK